jgi:hypothetical protein
MQFTIFQESRKGSRSLNQDRIAYTVQPRCAAASS